MLTYQTEHRNECYPTHSYRMGHSLFLWLGFVQARQVPYIYTSLVFSSFILRQSLKTMWLVLSMQFFYLHLWITRTLYTTRCGFQGPSFLPLPKIHLYLDRELWTLIREQEGPRNQHVNILCTQLLQDAIPLYARSTFIGVWRIQRLKE